MARRVIQELGDDIDGSAPSETVKLSYRGVDYEVDLSARNAAALDEALAPYLESARRVQAARGARRTRSPKSGAATPSPKEVREWAKKQGMQVSDRGRVPADVTRRYQEAYGSRRAGLT